MAETTAIRDRAMGCILAMAAGDALGATLEFSARDTLPEVRDLVGGGPFRLDPGVWTDDTSMALCLADSIVAFPAFDGDDLMRRFVRWRSDGHNSPTGTCFDIGGTVAAALRRFERTGERANGGVADEAFGGNGSLMRLAPVAIAYAPDVEEARRVARLQSWTTHAAHAPADACAYFATLLVEALCGADREEVLRPREWPGHPGVSAAAAGSWRGKSRDDVPSTGYVVHTLEAALWCVGTSSSLEEAVVLAANLGDDSDTTAAVTGQLAGALWGASSVPERWSRVVAMPERLRGCVDSLMEVGRPSVG